MSDVPTVLQVGSPVINRGQSEYAVPSALRVGSPITREPPPAQARPPLTRRTDSGSSNRISQLFPSTPSLVSPLGSPGNASEASRQSFPSPLVPGPGTLYYIPSAPAPPTPKPSTFTEETAYNPIASIFTPESTLPPLDKSNGRTRKVLDRLALLNRGSFRGGRYNRLDNEEAVTSKGKLKGVEECDEPVGYDLSSLGGLPTKTHEAQRIESGKTGASARAQELDEATHVAEFESLEAQLGAGMTSIFHKPFTHTPAGPVPGYFPGHRRILSADDAAEEQAKEAQVEAEKTGQVVAVSAEVPIDISDFAGFARDFESMRSLTAEAGLIRKGAETSYFFPEDPQMPNWRPATMSQWWLLMLVVIALSLAGIQEYLCQRSMSAVRQDPKNGGLTSFEGVAAMDPSIYFAWKYAPIMIFVFYGVLWQMSDFEVKRLEPFYQLSKKTGATAGESLNMDYLTFMSWLVPLRALRHKQYAVIYSSLGTLIASSLVPVLQSSSLYMHPSKLNRNVTGLKSIRVQPIWSRAVSACLVAVACCGGALMYAMRRKSGLQSDPKGIAGIAAMATKSHILADFKGLDCAPLEQIHKKLRNRRYILHKSSLWQGEYIKDSKEKIHEHGSDPRPLMLRYRSGIPFISFLIAFTIAVPVFTFVDDLSIFKENFPWIMTGLATVIRILWNTMNCDIRMLQPFYLLSLRHAPAKTLTLDYAGTNPFWLPIKAFLNRHYLVMFVAFGSVLAEICTVCVSSISVDGRKFIPGNGGKNTDDDHDGNANDATDRYNTDQTFRSFWTSFTLAMIILLYLIAIALIAYAKRSHKFMPRQIGTMASVLAYIHQSKMLVSFVDTEKFNSNKMTRHLEKTGKTYALGWFRGRDGEDHLGIDEEEIHSAYVYGKDWTEGRLRPGRDTEWEHY